MRLETISSLFATVALPGYLGWLHQSVLSFLIYSVVAGMALAIGDRFTLSWLSGANGLNFASYAGTRTLLVLIGGGIVYFLTLILI